MDIHYSLFLAISVVSFVFLIWNCIEVGSNDAANLVNAVFGARVLRRKRAVFLAGIFVILGAVCSSPVMNTVRKGIFDISLLGSYEAICIFLAAYLVNAILLYAYSGYGIPVSTTATLVFSLAGGSVGAFQGFEIVQWSMLGRILIAIIVSVFLSGLCAFVFQRLFRTVIGEDCHNHRRVLMHGPWISALIMIALFWFMGVKGLQLSFFSSFYAQEYGVLLFLFCGWVFLSFIIWLVLFFYKNKGTQYLFHITSILGMICMAFAFGQNDLANCASPGLAIYLIIKHGVSSGSQLEIPLWGLFFCGFLIFIGMHTKRAQRVTRAEINTASQQSKVKLYAPRWCCFLARAFLSLFSGKVSSTKEKSFSKRDERGKKKHYDTLRASVILSVSGGVIAAASSLGLPVSTTYVSFAAVISTGWADHAFETGASEVKLGRTIWVISSWFIGSFIAFISCMFVVILLNRYKIIGICVVLAINIVMRIFFKNRADKHEKIYHLENSKTS